MQRTRFKKANSTNAHLVVPQKPPHPQKNTATKESTHLHLKSAAIFEANRFKLLAKL